jgi:uncharacterized cupredoxin-like copper-binding protein
MATAAVIPLPAKAMRAAISYAVICAAVLAGTASATAAGAAHTSTLRADVGEWSIVPSTGAVPAGRVRIDVRNLGRDAHQIVLVRTTSFAQRLPLRENRAVVQPLHATPPVRPGGRASFVVSLSRGSYLLLDNLPWHYWKGTSVAFSVR